ncbi:MAG: Protein phosphatase methylesterase 1 [Heterodermia speciosa]|uniref:Protein phosphatase methylesterase 1 n=1 Tax=Heterodermia speciosa TaxID=116794 RepID=A0A8H3I3N6_9LECA|nr:MAG: Protein phosphatase methylesterase 1 [Heterodermia speciosa]
MSNLQRSFAKAKLAGLPLDPPLPHSTFEEQEVTLEDPDDDLKPLPDQKFTDDDSSSASSASSASSTGTIRPSPTNRLFARPKGPPSGRRPLDPLLWSDFFDQELYLDNPRAHEIVTHHVYLTLPLEKGPLFVTHHGAGSSGLSFAMLTSELRKALPNSGVLSLDARGHGETTVKNTGQFTMEGPLNLSLEILSQDLLDVIRLTQKKLSWSELPDMVFLGHSLGGAVTTDLASSGKMGDVLLGYAIFDVVEGSAIDALQSMQSYLSTRPRGFPSLSAGIEWHTRSRTLRNTTSARVSVPSLLCQENLPGSTSGDGRPWTWRTDLAATQPYWEGWFVGLSKKFLEAKGGKLLLLAGTDRLDKELMIGQMQGKYQLQVFPEAGHFIHEDQAEKTAMVVADFYRRNDRSALILPPKVGDLLRQKS